MKVNYAAKSMVNISDYDRGIEQALEQPRKVSIVEVHQVEPVFEEVISEVCQFIVNEGNTNRRVSKVMTVNYPTTVNFSEFDSSEEWIESDKCIVPILIMNKATTNDSVSNNLQTSSAAYEISDMIEKILKCFEYYNNIPSLIILPANSEEILDNSDSESKIYDRGKNMTVEKVKTNELLVMLQQYWAPWALSHYDFLEHDWSSHLTLPIEGIYGGVFDRGKLFTAKPMDETIVISMNK